MKVLSLLQILITHKRYTMARKAVQGMNFYFRLRGKNLQLVPSYNSSFVRCGKPTSTDITISNPRFWDSENRCLVVPMNITKAEEEEIKRAQKRIDEITSKLQELEIAIQEHPDWSGEYIENKIKAIAQNEHELGFSVVEKFCSAAYYYKKFYFYLERICRYKTKNENLTIDRNSTPKELTLFLYQNGVKDVHLEKFTSADFNALLKEIGGSYATQKQHIITIKMLFNHSLGNNRSRFSDIKATKNAHSLTNALKEKRPIVYLQLDELKKITAFWLSGYQTATTNSGNIGLFLIESYLGCRCRDVGTVFQTIADNYNNIIQDIEEKGYSQISYRARKNKMLCHPLIFPQVVDIYNKLLHDKPFLRVLMPKIQIQAKINRLIYEYEIGNYNDEEFARYVVNTLACTEIGSKSIERYKVHKDAKRLCDEMKNVHFFPQTYNDHIKRFLSFCVDICPSLKELVSGNQHGIHTTQPKYKWWSSHSARHTFTNLQLSLNVPTETIIASTGHKTDETLKSFYLQQKEIDDLRKRQAAAVADSLKEAFK